MASAATAILFCKSSYVFFPVASVYLDACDSVWACSDALPNSISLNKMDEFIVASTVSCNAIDSSIRLAATNFDLALAITCESSELMMPLF